MSRNSKGTFSLFALILAIIILFLLLRTEDCVIDVPQSGNSSSVSTSIDSSDGDSSDSSSSSTDSTEKEIVISRVGLSGYRLENGVLVPFEDDSNTDFSDNPNDNYFGVRDGETIVPGCVFVASMEITNNSNYALNYWMEIRMPEEYFSLALAQQLKVTLTVGNNTYTTVVGQPMGDNRAPLGQIPKGEHVTFTISVEFIQSDDNNATQGQTVMFDLYIMITQAV